MEDSFLPHDFTLDSPDAGIGAAIFLFWFESLKKLEASIFL
jgi:hypothetical protein